MKSILILGSCNADLVISLDRLPTIGETILSTSNTVDTKPGGKGANQAVAVARLAQSSTIRAVFACCYGDDFHGDLMCKAMSENDVDMTVSQKLKGVTSGQAIIFVLPDGSNAITVVGGANQSWPSEFPNSLQDAIKSASLILLQQEVPLAVNVAVVQIAEKHSVPIMWDTGGEDRLIPTALLSKIGIVCCNESELARNCGAKVKNKGEAIAGARMLQQRGANDVLVTLGQQGAVFAPKNSVESIIFVPSTKMATVVDTTGAGDTFRGAFATLYALSYPVRQCLEYASSAAALCTQKMGAMDSIPRHEDLADSIS